MLKEIKFPHEKALFMKKRYAEVCLQAVVLSLLIRC